MTSYVRWAAFAVVLGGGSLTLGACMGTCGFTGPGTVLEPVRSGRYETIVAEAPGVAFPWLEADGDPQVVIDREAEVVVVTYQKNGATVEERWRVTGSR